MRRPLLPPSFLRSAQRSWGGGALAALALAAIALLAASCRPPEDPATRYRRFAAAAREGDAEAVWAMLSEGSQERLKGQAEALSAKKPAAGLHPEQLVLGDLAPTAPQVKSAKVVRQSGDEATVEVEVEGGPPGQVEMRREKDQWKIVLPGG